MLRDAVAARVRRRIRDAVLLLLLVVLAVVSTVTFLAWLVVAVVAYLGFSGDTAHRRRNAVALLVVAGIVVLAIVVLPQALASVGPLPGLADGSLPVVVLGLLTLAVIGADVLAVHHLVYTCFRPGRFAPDVRHAGSGWERAVRTLGHASFHLPLTRVAAADERAAENRDEADVVVHRGFSPFVGAGKLLKRKVIALPLEPVEEEDEGEEPDGVALSQPRGISVVELQQHVAAAIDKLRSSTSLGPGGRLEDLTQREQILMAANRLVTNLHTQPQPAVLPDLDHPPAAHVPAAAARRVADAPPIRASYRKIDQLSDPVLAPLRRSLVEWVMLPATVISRLRSVFHRFTPLVQRDGEVVPDRYGAGKSLRELAAANDVQTYFQDVDVERYVKILDAILIRAVGQYLEEHGYSVVEFMRQADPMVNFNTNVSGGTFFNSAVGFGNTVQGDVGPPGPPKGRP